jgi:hypothetical protein
MATDKQKIYLEHTIDSYERIKVDLNKNRIELSDTTKARINLTIRYQSITYIENANMYITHISYTDKGDEKKIKKIIKICNDIYEILDEEYRIIVFPILFKGLGFDMEEYKMAISDLKESTDDLSCIFFKLRKDKDFINVTKELEQLFDKKKS